MAVPDRTRPFPVPEALAALADRLPPGVRVRVVVGLGLHEPMNDAALAPSRAACPWPVVNHAPDACVNIGEVHGVPLSVHPWLAEADLRLSLGVVELHQYAGFSGGHKAVVVGGGGRDTIGALHARDLVCDPRVVVGKLDGNPFRDAIDALGEHLGPGLSLLRAGGGWVAGPPRSALRLAAAALTPWYPVPERAERVLLRVPSTKAESLYQASRAATYLALSPAPPLRPGALLVLDAACPDGAGRGEGERAFGRVMAEWRGRLEALLVGPPPTGGGVQRAFLLARLLQEHRLVVAGCAEPEALRALGIEATSEPAERVAGPGALVVDRPFDHLPQLVPPGDAPDA